MRKGFKRRSSNNRESSIFHLPIAMNNKKSPRNRKSPRKRNRNQQLRSDMYPNIMNYNKASFLIQ
jgi:hypothetical protein